VPVPQQHGKEQYPPELETISDDDTAEAPPPVDAAELPDSATNGNALVKCREGFGQIDVCCLRFDRQKKWG
jgi:hypothetical protein